METTLDDPLLSQEKTREMRFLTEICLRIRDPSIRRHYTENWRDEASLVKSAPIASLPHLSTEEKERYSRQIFFVGEGNQQRLTTASVVVLGAGGVGSPCLYYLAGAGIGHITIVDFDQIERSNLNRQVLYGEKDVGHPKVDVARARLLDMNPDIDVEAVKEKVTPENAIGLIQGHDFVICAIDDSFVVNEACVRARIPFVLPFATTSTFGGGIFISGPGGCAPCYDCAFNRKYIQKIGPDRSTGVFGFIPGVVGSLAALEVVKHVLNLPRQSGHLITLDMWAGMMRSFPIAPQKRCEICGH